MASVKNMDFVIRRTCIFLSLNHILFSSFGKDA